MNLLQKLQTAVGPTGIPVETGVFTNKAPDKYIVIVPLIDSFGIHADNEPGVDIQEARISIYIKGNYMRDKNAVVRALLSSGITITSRQYIGFESETGYHHYNVDVADYYETEEIQ